MKMLKKGLLGCDLKHQVGFIGILYAALSVLALIFGFVLIQHPQYFADGALKNNEEMENKLQANAIQLDDGDTNMDDMEAYYDGEMENMDEMDYGGPIEGDDSLDSEEVEYVDSHEGSIETYDDSTENEDQVIDLQACSGEDSHCCTAEDPCGLDEGDCDSDMDCQEGLVCGADNCPVNSGPHWDAQDDCCQVQTDTCQSGIGGTYRGFVNQTVSGLNCQAWISQTPNQHPHSKLGDHNKCRNPDGMPGGVWCYTTQNNTRWEYCQVDSCENPEEEETKRVGDEGKIVVDAVNTEEKVDNEEVINDGNFDPNAEIIGDSDDSEEENSQEDSNLETESEILDKTELNEDSVRKNNTEDLDSDLTNNDNKRVKRDADYIEGMEESIRNSSDPDENLSDGRKHYNLLLKFLKKEGVECVVAALLKLACSIFLIMGVSQGKSWFLVPWLVEECLSLVGCLLQAIVSTAHSKSWSVSGGLLFVLLYVVGGYSMYSVASYHGILRRMNAHSREIISSVSQGGFQSGMNYQRLEEECWQSQPNIVSEFREVGPGFVREKKVDMEENDEHVLYVQ